MARKHMYEMDAMWWRGKMLLDGQRIVPQPPLEPYNPFQAFKPSGLGNRGEPRSIVYELLKVNPESPQAVCDFCQRFGVLGPVSEFRGWDIIASREIETTAPGTLGEQVMNKFGEAAADITPATEPMSLDEFRQAHEDLTSAVSFAKKAKEVDGDEAEVARQNLCRICNYKTRLARPRLNWNAIQNRFQMGWHIGSLQAAIYLMLFFDVQSDGKIANCPWCGQFFLAEHPRAKFCSYKCLNAYKQKKFRESTKTERPIKTLTARGKNQKSNGGR